MNYNWIEKYKLQDILHNLIAGGSKITEIIWDLQTCMVKEENNKQMMSYENKLKIVNPLAIEAYLF